FVCDDAMDFPTISGNTEVCQNGLINIEGSQVPDATEYFWKGPNNFNQTGTSLTITNAQPTHSGIYTFFAVRPGGTTCDTAQVEVSIVVNPTHLTTNNQTICFGETYVVGSSVYATSGTYTDTLQTAFGCDSIVTTNLTVLPSLASTSNISLCDGSTYNVGSSVYSTPGTYVDTLLSTNGCDSVVTTNLTIVYPTSDTISIEICFGGSVTVGSSTYTDAGTYTDSLQNVFGCDSVITTIVTVSTAFQVSNPRVICEGQSVVVGNSIYYTPGTYIDTLISTIGCDSIVTTTLIVNPIDTIVQSQILCFGETYSYNGHVYAASGTYVDTLVAVSGCDSIIITELTIRPQIVVSNPQLICIGDSYTINNNTYFNAGTYHDTLTSIHGCDSIIETVITFRPAILENNPQELCQGESYTINGHTYSAAGTYQDTLTSIHGCDSIVQTVIVFRPTSMVNNPQGLCDGDSYTINGHIYTTPGSYVDTLVSVHGCDSIVTTIITTQNPTLNTAVAIDGITLSAVENNATYQWVDCNNNNAYINGATGQSFSPAVNGSYGVILTSTICTDVTNQSPCYTINSVGVADISQQLISIYPNPTSTQVTIKSDKLIQTVQVKDLNGKLIYEVHSNAMETVIDLGELSDGVYILEITSDFGSKIERIIKQH
ncbi:MAG TPA: T9SS type A sorting domain-containing protein, partial [Taishania sp.]|nr:T9SS type A sorting domain-containing protein [Taishania sp.]